MASEGTAMSELKKPRIEVPEGDVPTELTIRDLVVGTGPRRSRAGSYRFTM